MTCSSIRIQIQKCSLDRNVTSATYKLGTYLESGGGEADQIGVVVGKRKLLCLGIWVCECDRLQRDTKHYQTASILCFNASTIAGLQYRIEYGDTSTSLCDYMAVV